MGKKSKAHKPKATTGSHLERIEDKIDEIGRAMSNLATVLANIYTVVDPARPPGTMPYQPLRAGRWHLRDGTGYGKPPYHYDPQTGTLEAPPTETAPDGERNPQPHATRRPIRSPR